MTRPPAIAIVRHELRMLSRSRAAWVVFAVLVIAVTCAAWNGQRWANHQRATIAQVRSADDTGDQRIFTELDALESQHNPRPALQLAGMAWYIFQPEGAVAPAPHLDPRRPEAAASEWVGARHAVLPPAPLAALATGQSDLYPYYARVTIRTRPILVQSDELENPANLVNGRFDLAFFITFCWPLVVMPLLYNVVSEERENGTLALIASQSISLRTLLAARLVIRGGAAVIVTIVASLLALLIDGGVSSARPPDLVIWGLAIGGVGLFWCGLAAVVNLTTWRSAVNATALTASWLALVVIAPAVVDHVASAVAPVPSRVELINAVRDAGNLSSSQLASLMSAYYEEHPDAAPSAQSADVGAIRGLAQQDALDRRIDPIVARYHQAVDRRQVLVDRLRFVSPPLLIYDATLQLAGTSTIRFRRFADQVDRYHREWRAYFYPLVHARTSMTKALYKSAPRFTFAEEPRAATTRRVLGLIGVTTLAGVTLLLVAFSRVTKTAVR